MIKIVYESVSLSNEPKKDLDTPEPPRKKRNQRFSSEQRSSSIFISDYFTPSARNSTDDRESLDLDSINKASANSRQSFEAEPVMLIEDVASTPRNFNILEQGVFELESLSLEKSNQEETHFAEVELNVETLSDKSSSREESSELLE